MSGLAASLDDLVQQAQSLPHRPRIALAAPHDADGIESLCRAHAMGIADGILVGESRLARPLAEKEGLDISPFGFVEAHPPAEAIRQAIGLVRSKKADILMKGLVPTKLVLHGILDPHDGLRAGHVLSQVAAFRPPRIPRLFLLTDCGINIAPNFSRKIEIVRNAIRVAQQLGIQRPRVAMLAAVEKVELPAMPATLDAKVVERMAEAGQFPEAYIQGPLGLDNAVSEELAQLKGITGEVAGRADILCVPDIETGNMLYKTLTCFAGVEIASVLVGAKAPVVLTSRSDTAMTKLYSIALAGLLAEL